MKKMVVSSLILAFLALSAPQAQSRGGAGAAVAAGVAGLMTGVVLSKASDGHSKRRVERIEDRAYTAKQQAIKAQKETQQLRKEQEKERIQKLAYKLEKQKSQQQSDFKWMLLIS
ncbi:MAG: hypothetical protein V1855_00230, partial [bacterium]